MLDVFPEFDCSVKLDTSSAYLKSAGLQALGSWCFETSEDSQ